MFDLRDPETRSGWHTFVFTVAALTLVALVWRIVEFVRANPQDLTEIARWCLCIIALAVIGRNFLIKAGPIVLDATGNPKADSGDDK
jgi:hypothetical protein